MEIAGEGTYGKVYRAKLKKSTQPQSSHLSFFTPIRQVEGVVQEQADQGEEEQEDDLSRMKALKLLKLDPHIMEGFPITSLREILILKQLDHPNIVKLEDVFHLDTTSQGPIGELHHQSPSNWKRNKIYMVFEYLPHDLMGLIDFRPKWDPAQLKCLLKQMLEGIAYMHEKRYYHRDLKSANVFVSAKGEVKLGDLGLAKFIDQRMQRNLTTKVVTRWYRAPELLLDDYSYSGKIDVWSIGCIWVELLTEGHGPFRG